MKNAESVKARLKNKAVKDGRTFQDLALRKKERLRKDDWYAIIKSVRQETL